MEIRIAAELDVDEAARWDDFVHRAPSGHPRQRTAFTEVDRLTGSRPLFAIGTEGGEIVAGAQLLLRPHRFLRGRYAVADALSGPVAVDLDRLMAFLGALVVRPEFAKVGGFSVTSNLLDDQARAASARLEEAGWRVRFEDPFRRTGHVDCTRSPDEIAASFSKSARREMRRAERQGVTIERVTDPADAAVFFRLLEELRERNGLPPMDTRGFDRLFKNFLSAGEIGAIFAARKDDVVLAGLKLYRSSRIAHGRHFASDYGALKSLDNLRIAPLLWHSGMVWAREHGCAALDVEGYDASLAKDDPLYAVYKYKGEFNPRPVVRLAEHILVRDRFAFYTAHARKLARAAVRRAR